MLLDREIRDDPWNWVSKETGRFPLLTGYNGPANVRDMVFCTRLIHALNIHLSYAESKLSVGWGVLQYENRGHRYQEIDLGVFIRGEIDDKRMWNGLPGKNENIKIILFKTPELKAIIEVKRDISLSNHRAWAQLTKFSGKLASVSLPLWLISENCDERDYRPANTRARNELNFDHVHIFSLRRTSRRGEEDIPKHDFNNLLTKILRLQ